MTDKIRYLAEKILKQKHWMEGLLPLDCLE
jgi:hypothetical protein